jgi:hypothetical protein
MSAHHDIFQGGHIPEKLHGLESARNPQKSDDMRAQAVDGFPLKNNTAPGKEMNPGYEIKKGSFTGPVGSDDGFDLTFLDFKGEVDNSHQTAKGLFNRINS